MTFIQWIKIDIDSPKCNSKNLQNDRKSVHTQRERCLAMTNMIYGH